MILSTYMQEKEGDTSLSSPKMGAGDFCSMHEGWKGF